MSVHGMKPIFTDIEGYKAWRTIWSNVYQDVSSRIRVTKRSLVTSQKASGGASTKEIQDQQRKLAGERVIAHKLMSVLLEGKLRMAKITQSKKEMAEHQAQFPLNLPDAERVDFHFNKKHLEFPWIPMWVVKAKGKTFYVHHVDASVPWTTRETPDNPATKGAIRVKRCNVEISRDGVATLSPVRKELAA